MRTKYSYDHIRRVLLASAGYIRTDRLFDGSDALRARMRLQYAQIDWLLDCDEQRNLIAFYDFKCPYMHATAVCTKQNERNGNDD